MARTLDDHLRRSAARTPDATAIVAGDRRLSYGEFERAVDGFAAGLSELGVRPRDRVAVALPNSAEAAIAIYGTVRLGAAFSPLNPTIKQDKLSYVLDHCSAVALICDEALLPAARAARAVASSVAHVIAVGQAVDGTPAFEALVQSGGSPAVRPLALDLASIIYTSGSTGVPKGVTLTHANMTFAADSITEYLEMRADDRVLCVPPLSFDYGLFQLLMSVKVGGTLVLERNFAFAGRVVELLERESITGLPGVPTLFAVLTSLRGLADRELPALRFLTNTGAALSEASIAAIRRTFPRARLYSMYGLTECKRVSYLPPDQLDRRPRSVGIAIPGTEVWIEDDEGRRLGPGEVGELMVRGPHVMQGYWNDPAATEQRLRPGRWPWERVLATGDLFRADDEGYLYFVGRRDDIIKSRGEKVAPREVEEVLQNADGVREVAVIGVPDERLGEAVHAHVAPQPSVVLDPAELRRHCAACLEDFMVPQKILVHDELPKSANGKIDRRALALQAAGV